MKNINLFCRVLCGILAAYSVKCDIFSDTVASVERAVAYYEDNYSKMNIDGIFGLRVLEGQLKIITEHPELKYQLSDDLYLRLKNCQQQAATISKASLKDLQESDTKYYSLMNPVVQRPWFFARSYRKINPKLKWNTEKIEMKLTEHQSDKCMSELFASEPQQHRCSLSSSCIEVMSIRGTGGYFITHQLLYTMLADQTGCLQKLNESLQSSQLPMSVEQLQEEFCANNFFETSQSVTMQNGSIDPRLHDLFLEQQLVCSMLGYFEFLHNDWLQQIFSWQMASGCFGETPEEEEAYEPHNSVKSNRIRQKEHPEFGFTPQRLKRSVDRVNSLARPVHLGQRPVETFVGLNSNAQKRKFNDSRIRRKYRMIGYTPKDVRGAVIGQHPVRLNNGMVINRDPDRVNVLPLNNNEQGKLGDTHVQLDKAVAEDIRHVRRMLTNGNAPKDKVVGEAPVEDGFSVNHQINRKLLYEKVLKDGCLAHKTAVALGALSQYLRFIVFANSSGFHAMKHLNGINYLMHPESLIPASSGSRLRAVIRKEQDELLSYDELNRVGTKISKDVYRTLTEHPPSNYHSSSFKQISSDFSFEGLASVSSTYAVVVLITVVVLIFLYRSLRKHRTSVNNRNIRRK